MKNFLKFLAIVFVMVFPSFAFAQGEFITCDTNCGYYDLLKLVNNIINWIIDISIPVSSIVFAYAGFTYMTTGVSDKKSEAKKMIQSVFIGLVLILSAWLLVTTITNSLLAPSFRSSVPVQGVN